jgi:hypothetical protein
MPEKTKFTENNCCAWDQRIIVGGMPRAGTTLFRYLLDASDYIIAGPETGFFLRPFALQQARVERVSRRIDRSLSIGTDLIAGSIVNSTSATESFDLIMSAYLERTGRTNARVWAEKTPWNCCSYSWIQLEEPKVRFISLIRDPRDVVTSIMNGSYYVSPQTALETLRLVLRFKNPNHLIVRYEELVTNPETCLRQTLETCNLPFTKSIFARYQQISETRDPSKVNQPKVQTPISTQWVKRWCDPQHKERIAELVAHPLFHSLLGEAGYEL